MHFEEDDVLLRIYLGESDMYHGRPVYEQIVLKARELKLSGATVLRGIMGFGAHSHMRSAGILTLSADLPIVIEIVDKEEKIDMLLPFLDEFMGEGLVTKESIHVYRYRKEK
jgi:PII-like signaling protein